MPTPFFICGAECGELTATATSPTAAHWTQGSFSGITIDTTTYNPGGGGTRSYKLTMAAATVALVKTYTTTARVACAKANFYISSYSSNINLIYFINGGAVSAGVRINSSTNTFEGFCGSTTQAGGAVATGQWYRIDIEIDMSANPWVLQWSIDGVAQTNVSSAQASDYPSIFRIGALTSSTATFYVDDIVVSLTDGDYPLGDCRVEGLIPNADGTHSFSTGDFKYNNTTNIDPSATDVYTYLDERLNSNADYISQNVTGTKYVEIGFSDPSASDDAWGMEVVAAWHSAGTSANRLYIKINDGGTINDTDGGDISNTGLTYTSKQLATAPSGGAWTQAKLNAVKARLGYSTDISPVPYCDGVVLEIAQPYSASAIKTFNDLARASIKTINDLDLASVKTVNDLA